MGNVKTKRSKGHRNIELIEQTDENREDRHLISSTIIGNGQHWDPTSPVPLPQFAPSPWGDIVAWCATSVPSVERRIDNFSSLLRRVDDAVSDPDFLEYEAEDVFGGKFVLEGDFVSWAQILLRNKRLAERRYQLVPRFISEDAFWHHFFCVVRQIIASEITEHPPKRDVSNASQSPRM